MTTAIIGHRYSVGERVVLDLRAGYFMKGDSAFIVVAQLPPLGNDFQYRIKSIGESHERVALEHHLTPASTGDATADSFFKESKK
jgi:hypothetical protein